MLFPHQPFAATTPPCNRSTGVYAVPALERASRLICALSYASLCFPFELLCCPLACAENVPHVHQPQWAVLRGRGGPIAPSKGAAACGRVPALQRVVRRPAIAVVGDHAARNHVTAVSRRRLAVAAARPTAEATRRTISTRARSRGERRAQRRFATTRLANPGPNNTRGTPYVSVRQRGGVGGIFSG